MPEFRPILKWKHDIPITNTIIKMGVTILNFSEYVNIPLNRMKDIYRNRGFHQLLNNDYQNFKMETGPLPSPLSKWELKMPPTVPT